MKKTFKNIALFCALISACLIIAACGNKTSDDNKKLPDNKTVSTVNSSDNSSGDLSLASQSTEQSSTANTGSEESIQSPESSADTPETEEKSEVQQSEEVSENSTESKPEASEEEKSNAPENSSTAETSHNDPDAPTGNDDVSDIYNGYYFDDEQIVKNYHTAEEFTSDEKFNALFKENKTDKEMTAELKNADNEMDMRNITIKYSEIWKSESEKAYSKLSDMLEEKPEEKEKLIASQSEWTEGLEAAESSFQSEAEEKGLNGTQLFLSVDSAMLNYYKGRTAVLYYQIYLLDGSFAIE